MLGLNPAQARAVACGDGPLLVLAGAGSGKTRVLTARIVRLTVEEGIPLQRILAVTFTNKAAGVMRTRVAELLGAEPSGLWIGTFHSIAARLLRREGHRLERGPDFSIYDEADSLRTLKTAMKAVDLDPGRWSPGLIRARISDAKNQMIGPADYSASAFDLLSRVVAQAYPAYEAGLKRSCAFDFDDLLLHAVRLLEDDPEAGERYARRFRHVLVDEYQDTNHAQYRMVRALARVHGNVCVVGDDDQSIYGWRGADLRNILDFERDFPGAEVVRLEQNYRSTRVILEIANEVIAHNRARKSKRLFTAREGGEPAVVARAEDEKSEAAWTVEQIERMPEIAAADVAILYRTNAQSRPYEDALRRAGLPYRIVGGVRFYERREIRDVLAYLQLAVNPADEASFRRAVAWPRRGVGTVTLDRLSSVAAERGSSLLEAARAAGRVEGLPAGGARALEEFAAGIEELGRLAAEAGVEVVIRKCLARFGILAALELEEDGEDRIANLTELMAAAAAFDPLEVEEPVAGVTPLGLYLQSTALMTDLDELEPGTDAVTLMTLHNAKGLEFPVVFLGGLEEGLFPLSRAAESEAGLEEERRLFYVGVTRAQDRLFLTLAERRWRAGAESHSLPSSFLEELPDEMVRRQRVGRRGRRSGTGGRRARAFGIHGSSGSFEEDDSAAAFSWHRASPAAAVGARVPATERGLQYDYADTQVPLALEPGSRVVHPSFGEGTIVALSGSGRAAKAEIEFESVGRKKVVLRFGGLRPA